MSLTITKQPYSFSPRGQQLLFVALSTNSGQAQFKYGIKIYIAGTSQTLQFYISPDPNGYLNFDMSSIVTLWNEDEANLFHAKKFTVEQNEVNGKGKDEYTVTIEEWWNNSGVFTHNSAADVTNDYVVFNAYLQPSYGYKPNTNSSIIPYGFKLDSATSRVMSDRFHDTHNWFYARQSILSVPEAQRTYIPCLSTDYGLLTIQTTQLISGNDVGSIDYSIFSPLGTYSYSNAITVDPSIHVTHVGAYPMNISNDIAVLATPANTPNWYYYQLIVKTKTGNTISMRYVFYNAELYGQSDCRHDYVRLGWVNSRGGWDYFNFIKKNEWTNNAERKQYRQVLYRQPANSFQATQRQLTDRETIIRRTLQITSDWVQENEFVFLRNLFASNQVQIIQEDGTQVPVSIADTGFVEKRERNGKLYNVTLNVTPSQDYWT